MEVFLTIDVRLPDAEVENIVFDEWGNAEVTLSAGGVLAKCSIDAMGSDHGTIRDALLSLAGVQIIKAGQKPQRKWRV
jgi:hypothetical protein